MSNSQTVTAASEVTDGSEVLVELDDVKKHFDEGSFVSNLEFTPGSFPPITRNPSSVRAVDGVNLTIRKGETIGLVGESGCGKSTLGRTIIRMLDPTEGSIYYDGQDISELSNREMRRKRSEFQMILQDPQSSLNPRMRVGEIIEEPMKAHGMLDADGRESRARELLEMVELEEAHYNRFPHEFSGGQRQRVNLARALSVDPDFIVCDEPVSALDVSVQAQVLNTMKELQAELDLTYLFITHDLSVVRYVCDRVAVMYLGRIVERAGREELFENPKHPYTQALLESIPVPDPRQRGNRSVIEGEIPSPADPPSGCRFRTRCPKVIAPPEYELGSEEWEAIRRFTNAVSIQSFAPTDAGSVRSQFFPDGIPGGEAGETVEAAIRHVGTDHSEGVEWTAAEKLLTTSFADRSICAKEHPAVNTSSEYDDETHYVSCHLYDENES